MTMAIDFGTCNTVLARWNTATRRVDTLRLEDIGKTYRYRAPGAANERESAIIPSLVHYGEGNALSAGAQVENAGLASHRGTFRWIKLDILRNNNRARRINGDLITPRQAADDLIGRVLLSAGLQADEDLVVTLPVEAFDQYVDWLQGAVLQTFRGTVRMLDEATACILGYDTHVREGEVYVVFDFGGGTLDVSVVKTRDLAAGDARPCDVLGRAGEEIGGSLVDQWMLSELQQSEKLSDQDVADVGTVLLRAAEEAKVRLSGGEARVEVTQLNDLTARLINYTFSAEGLRRMLDSGRPDLSGLSLYRLVARTVERALDVAQSKYGTRKSEVKSGVHGGRLQPAAGCGRRGVESVSRLPGALRGPVRGHCARRVPLRGRRHESRPGARVLPARLGPGEEGLRAGPGGAQGNALSHAGAGLDQIRERRLRRRNAAGTCGRGALRDAAAGGRVGSRGRPASAARHDPARGRFAA